MGEPMEHNVLGVDPGVRTGLAWMIVPDDDIPRLEWTLDMPNGLQGFSAFWDDVMLERIQSLDYIVFENFIKREGKFGVDMTPLEIKGFIIGKAEQSRIPLIIRPPAGRKKQVDNEVLKRLGLYLPGNANRNILEAVRHVVADLKTKRHMPTLEGGWGLEDL